jgi:two-component system sensor histidine kinase KdpD
VYRQTEEVRRSLLAAVSVDLRSPLAAIKASATDLLDRSVSRSREAEREALLAINDQADRLNALVANLLDMSRNDAGMLRSRAQMVDVSETLATCVDRVSAQYPSVAVGIAVAPEAALVIADPVFLERVATNLLANAMAATIQAGWEHVEVEARRTGGETVLRVIDPGAGVPANIRELLFYPFYSLERRGARLGTGLGLAICKGLLAVMGGRIWVEDTPGGGANLRRVAASTRAAAAGDRNDECRAGRLRAARPRLIVTDPGVGYRWTLCPGVEESVSG